jgi:hypothetical protein
MGNVKQRTPWFLLYLAMAALYAAFYPSELPGGVAPAIPANGSS